MKQPKLERFYCGPMYLPVFFRRILSGVFNPACRLHDMHYGKQGLITRKQADRRFLHNMLKLALKRRKGFKLALTVTLACAFYFFVRMGGYFSYKKKPKK